MPGRCSVADYCATSGMECRLLELGRDHVTMVNKCCKTKQNTGTALQSPPFCAQSILLTADVLWQKQRRGIPSLECLPVSSGSIRAVWYQQLNSNIPCNHLSSLKEWRSCSQRSSLYIQYNFPNKKLILWRYKYYSNGIQNTYGS